MRNLAAVGLAWARALGAQLHYRMLLLTVAPFVAALAIWSVIMWFGLQWLIDWLQAWFTEHNYFSNVGELLAMFGLLAFKAMVVPFIAMWLLLPLMIFTALFCMALFAMPAIARHVGQRHFPLLEKRRGGSLFGSIGYSLYSFLIFAGLWLLSLPLTLLPPVGMLLQPLLWGWLTYRVIVYDALADYADAEERRSIIELHRWPLLVIGTIAGLFGAAPGMLWLGGVLSVLFLPVLAGFSIWLYVVVFVFTGLWFQHYCLSALNQLRTGREQSMRVIEPDEFD